MYYFYSVLCNRIRHNCCCCFWLIIQISYSPANYTKLYTSRGGSILIMSTQCTLQLPETNTFYMQCILGVIIFYFKIFENLTFLANKGNSLLKLKHVGNVWSFLKKLSFHNFSSSVMYILLNKYFCSTVFKKTDFYFDWLPWIPLHFCVYDMRIRNGETLMKWLSE